MGEVSVLKQKLGTSRRLMSCYCLQLSSEHFYLQKMTEFALFIMYVSKKAALHGRLRTPLPSLTKGLLYGVNVNGCLHVSDLHTREISIYAYKLVYLEKIIRMLPYCRPSSYVSLVTSGF